MRESVWERKWQKATVTTYRKPPPPMLFPEAANSSAVPSKPPPPTLSTRGEETREEERRQDETRGDKRKQEETRRGGKSLFHPSKVHDILGESWSTNYLIVTRELNTLLQCEFGRPTRAQNIWYRIFFTYVVLRVNAGWRAPKILGTKSHTYLLNYGT